MSQTGVGALQSAFDMQARHTFVVVLQAGVDPVQAEELVASHCTH